MWESVRVLCMTVLGASARMIPATPRNSPHSLQVSIQRFHGPLGYARSVSPPAHKATASADTPRLRLNPFSTNARVDGSVRLRADVGERSMNRQRFLSPSGQSLVRTLTQTARIRN